MSDYEPCLGCAFVYMNHPSTKRGVCRVEHSANKYLVSIPKYTKNLALKLRYSSFCQQSNS